MESLGGELAAAGATGVLSTASPCASGDNCVGLEVFEMGRGERGGEDAIVRM
jgi:hypothetical protein